MATDVAFDTSMVWYTLLSLVFQTATDFHRVLSL